MLLKMTTAEMSSDVSMGAEMALPGRLINKLQMNHKNILTV